MTTHHLNDFYHRVTASIKRLQWLRHMHAPDIIIRNEQRLLNEAVSALIDDDEAQPSIVDIGHFTLETHHAEIARTGHDFSQHTFTSTAAA